MRRYFLCLVAFLIAVVTASCGQENEKSQAAETTKTDFKIESVESLSQHYVAVYFNQVYPSDAFALESLELRSGSGQLLNLKSAHLFDEGRGVVLETDTQDPVLYSLIMNLETASRNLSRELAEHTFYAASEFIGSTGPEPYVSSVVALSSTEVLITFDRKMDPDFAELPGAYQILAPNGEIPNKEEGRIQVTDARSDADDLRLVTLTTTPMTNIQYMMLVNNVIVQPGHALIHPDRNGGFFFGIDPIDNDPPMLLSAVSTGHTTVLASFNEPLWDSANEPFHYRICAQSFDASGQCSAEANLNVLTARLTGMNTQVVLETDGQHSGRKYYLQVNDVTDRSSPAPGNRIAENTVATFTGSGEGAPDIASAIAVDNTHVLVTFTERMSDDALDIASYRIDNPHLDVINAIFGDDRWHVILTTTPQERREYQLIAGNIHSDEGRAMVYPPTPARFVGFAGKDTHAPYLIAATAETSNIVRLYFSEPMAENALNPGHYDITFCPEDQVCTLSSLSQLDVLSVSLAESGTQAVLMVDNIAPRVEHLIQVSDQVTDRSMPLPHNPIDPALDSDTFGLLLDDKVHPGVENITITGTAQITLTFTEEVNGGAANPLYYRLCTVAIGATGVCPPDSRVQVLAAELNPSHTQVVLTTGPLIDGTHYYVWVEPGVTDTSGNIINDVDNQADIYYAGATSVVDPTESPKVVGAISNSNVQVTVAFSSVMGDSALQAGHYLFTQENVNGEVGTVFPMSAQWSDDTHTSVIITTTSQNEVTYRVTAVNVRDVSGNPLATKEGTLNSTFDPSSAVFAGSPPIAQKLTLIAGNWIWDDSDADGFLTSGESVTIDHLTMVLVDEDLDGKVDNWVDSNNNGVLDDGDLVSGLIDSDGDGLADNEELRGKTIMIVYTDGQSIMREVTSDPTTADTDNDGLTDAEEWGIGSDPRSADTDADGIRDYVEWNVVYSSPTDQDSDNDSLGDGFEHNFFLTSPILADTDGDQFTDDEELLEMNRNPKVADKPEFNIHVGEIFLQIDERYTYTDSKGDTVSTETSTNTSLSSGQNTSFANSSTTMNETVSSFDWEVGFGLRDAQDGAMKGDDIAKWQSWVVAIFNRFFIEVGLAGGSETTTGTTVQIDRESAQETQEALENSLSRMNEQSIDSEVVRELTSARISVNLNVDNQGDVAFQVSNLQVSVQRLDPTNRGKLIPIATLIAESTLITGADLEINLGPFDSGKGPFLFTNTEVYPNLIEELMRDPTSLVFKVVNYDINDEYNRNFAFSSQTIRDRTAGISFDFGELGSETHHVAANGVLNKGKYQGGFDDTGKAKGVELGYLLESILGIPKHLSSTDYIDAGVDTLLESSPIHDDQIVNNRIVPGINGLLETVPGGDDRLRNPLIKTGIIAGADKRVNSIAQGDDRQLVPFGTTGVAPKTLVIDPGSNGVLESYRDGDDQQEFISGYQLQPTCSAASIDSRLIGQFCDGGDGNNTDCDCTGPQNLVRINTFRNGDFGNIWYARLNGELPASADFDQITLKPGQDIQLAFLQDLDNDGLFAHEEFLYRSVDSSVNRYNNANFLPEVDPETRRLLPPSLSKLLEGVENDPFADSMDTDRDGIGDLSEARLGWLISVNGELERVYSSPASHDSDNDGLWDIQEQDLRDFCANVDDPRVDALCRNQIVDQVDATGIIVGKNGRLDTLASGDDEYALFLPAEIQAQADLDVAINQGLMFATVAILPGENGQIDTQLASDDAYTNASLVLPATDPMRTDTDRDRVSDGEELFGFAAAMSVVEGAETECFENDCTIAAITWGLAQTTAQGDDFQRIFPGRRSRLGDAIVTAGPNGILETFPEGDDVNVSTWFIVAGTDRIRNCMPGSGDRISNTDSSALLDPYAPALWNDSGTPTLSNSDCYVSRWDKMEPGKDLKLFGRIVTTDPLRRDTDNDQILDGLEVALGANPVVEDGAAFRDVDEDGLTDEEETRGWLVRIDGATGVLVRPSLIRPDSDFDGLPDYVERDIGSDPTRSDTDGDGISDYDEFRSVKRIASDQTVYSYSIYDYHAQSQLFPGFNLVVNGEAYNTDPNLSDTDGDTLTDYAELISGYKFSLPGSTDSVWIYTDPNNADTDGDGLTDKQEAAGISTAQGNFVTNAINADSDGDGTHDAEEVSSGSLTNVLVRDAMVTVSYESIFIANLDDCMYGSTGENADCPESTNVLWWLYANGDDGELSGKHLLSASDEFAYLPEGNVIPHASGHQSLVSDNVVAGLAPGEVPDSINAEYGLLMEKRACPGNDWPNTLPTQPGTCGSWTVVEAGETGYDNNAFVDWGTGGFAGLTDDFMVRWSGEIFLPYDGDYLFEIQSDDGSYLMIDGVFALTHLSGIDEAQDIATFWSDHPTAKAYGVVKNLSAGWHQIETMMYENGGDADMRLRVKVPGADAPSEYSPFWFKHTAGNGSYACIGVERDPTQSSYISLERDSNVSNNILSADSYSPDLPYYGSVQGAELKIFRDIVAEDTFTNRAIGDDNHPEHSRYYIDAADDIGSNVKTVMSVIIDLAASRKVVNDMVKANVESSSVQDSATLYKDAQDDRYYLLSEQGRMLYRQLADQNVLGTQRFVISEGETFELSGTLMKVNNLEELTNCPIGSSGVVSQFSSGCTKRFSRTFSYYDVIQQPTLQLNMNNLFATTYSTSTSAAGCEMDIDAYIRLY